MLLIIILVCLGLQYFTTLGTLGRKNTWFTHYISWLRSKIHSTPLWDGIGGIACTILPFLISVFLVEWILAGRLYNILLYIFDLLVLGYCLQISNYKKLLAPYFHAKNNNNLEAAYEYAAQFTGTPSQNIQDVNLAVNKAIFSQTYSRVFAMLFWFIVAQAFGVVLYYSCLLLRQYAATNDHELPRLQRYMDYIVQILDWIPSRLVGLSFAFMGHFNNTFKYLYQQLFIFQQNITDFITQLGLYALSDTQDTDEIISLVERTIVLWVVVIAVLTIVNIV